MYPGSVAGPGVLIKLAIAEPSSRGRGAEREACRNSWTWDVGSIQGSGPADGQILWCRSLVTCGVAALPSLSSPASFLLLVDLASFSDWECPKLSETSLQLGGEWGRQRRTVIVGCSSEASSEKPLFLLKTFPKRPLLLWGGVTF